MPSLLTTRGERFTLEPNQSYTLGRGQDCDLVVADIASSREHATLTIGRLPEIMSIEDLGSRNGTYVNEMRIGQPTPLHVGSRIRIGATLYLVGPTEEMEDDPNLIDTGTACMERLSLGQHVGDEIVRVLQNQGMGNTEFAGQLGSFGLLDILQLLVHTSRSGTLHIALEAGHAKIEVRQGKIETATYQELEGFPALLMIARQNAGLYWLVVTSEPVVGTIREPSSQLLLKLCTALDEAERDAGYPA